MRDQVPDAGSPAVWEVEFNVSVLVPLEPPQNVFLRGPQDVVDFVDLVQLIFAWEERKQTQDLEKDASDAPDVHFVVVVAFREQAFGRSVPSGGDVLGVTLSLHALARAEINQLNFLILQKNILPKNR